MASLPVVSASIIKSGDKIAATFDWLCVPEHMVILNNDMLEDWAPEFAAFTDVVDENVVVVVPPPCLDLGLNVPRQPLAPSTRFNVITSAEELVNVKN